MAQSNNPSQPDIVSAREEVERAKSDLARRVREASDTGRQLVRRTLETTRPLLVASLALGGGVLLLGIVRLIRRPKRRAVWQSPRGMWQPPVVAAKPPSAIGSLLRSAFASVAATLASRLMQRLSLQFEQKALPPHRTPDPRSIESAQRAAVTAAAAAAATANGRTTL